MDARDIAYLTEIGLTATAIDRIGQIVDGVTVFTSGPIQKLFVSDSVDNEGIRRYMSLWIFKENTITEAKQFMVKKDIDFVETSAKIIYTNIVYEEYDLVNFTEKSRLEARVIVEGFAELGAPTINLFAV